MLVFFIKRPIFASTLSIIVVLAGIMSIRTLPIAQYPDITPPTVTITTSYVGASAETVASTVAAPIEAQLNGIDGLEYYTSTASSDGSLTITATFAIGTQPEQATINVSNQVQTALPQLPKAVQAIGVIVKQRSTDILLVVGLSNSNPALDTLFVSNYATLNIVDDLKRLPGVGDVTVFGERDYSMRIWLDPDKMTRYGITVSDVTLAIESQSSLYATGRIGQEPALDNQILIYSVGTKGALSDPTDFENIIIKSGDALGFVRMKQIARVELGAQTYDSYMILDGKPTIGMAIFLQSGANALDVAISVQAKMEQLKKDFPNGLDYLIPFDTTLFIKASISEVLKTLAEAMLLVMFVVFIFLQNPKATLIPLIAVPVSLIGTFAGLYLFGFSINTLTLFAMVLAIGIVVDDAIVVLENVERLIHDEGLSPEEAAKKSLKEVSGAVIAIVLVLCAVFVPVAFLGGITGKLYQQFALTVATSVILSGLVALTLTPTLCSLFLKKTTQKNHFFVKFNQLFDGLTNRYVHLSKIIYHRPKTSLAAYGALLGLLTSAVIFIPQGFVPSEDQGYLISSMMLPDNASLKRMGDYAQGFQKDLRKTPEIAHVIGIVGFDLISGSNKSNSGTLFITLNPWDKRTRTANEVIPELQQKGFSSADGLGLIFNPPPIRGLGSAGGFEFYVQSRNETDFDKMNKVINEFIEKLKKDPRLTGINSFFRPTIPRLKIEIDEAKALSLGVNLQDVFQTIQSTVGAFYVNDFYLHGKTFQVQIQAEAKFRANPEDFGRLFVKNNQSQMVKLGTFLKVSHELGPEQVDRFNGFIAAHVLGNSLPNISSNAAINIVESIAEASLPNGYKLAWTGSAYQELKASNSAPIALSFACIMVFLILCAQYESWTLPIAVLLSVPIALLGAFSALAVTQGVSDVYFQIGLVVLIGLGAKNAILIIEFAAQKLREGLSLEEAALMAAKLRFRPIVMTSMAFILGVVPLALATGAGAGGRHSMGVGVLGGMLAATSIAPLCLPLFFKWFGRPNKQTSSEPSNSTPNPLKPEHPLE